MVQTQEMIQIEEVQSIICRVGKIESIGEKDELGESGFSSMNALELLMELETVYDISIPDDRFIAARTPHDLHQLVVSLKEEQAA